MTTTVQTKVQQTRKFLLILPLFVIPGLFIAFYAMGGGKGGRQQQSDKGPGMGFNMELPPPIFDKKEDKMDKMAFYKKAEEDSIRRKQLIQQDPYHRHEHKSVSLIPAKPAGDTQTDVLLQRLDVLKRRLDEPGAEKVMSHKKIVMQGVLHEETAAPPSGQSRDTLHADPELDRLNEMLEKIMHLQKGEQQEPEDRMVKQDMETSVRRQEKSSQVIAVAIPAMVERDQELVNGATIALRLTSGICYNGVIIRQGQLVYGTANFSNDRMQVVIRSIRCGQSIITTEWQVYDMDGLPGIHIPDGPGRQVARQSADQSIGGLNLSAYDPSIGAQVANAGIQTARNFFSRKVRTVRVTVPAGYQVLLKDIKAAGSTLQLLRDTADGRADAPSEGADRVITPPAVDSLQPYLHRSVSEGGISLMIRGVYQRAGVLWFYLILKNKSSFAFSPQSIQYILRQEKHIKRMAAQELLLQPLYDSLPSIVASGEEQPVLIGVKPFIPTKGRKVVIRMSEKDSSRILELEIKRRTIRNVYE